MGNLILKDCTIVTPLGTSAKRGKEMAELSVIRHGIVVVVDGIIRYAGVDNGTVEPIYDHYECRVLNLENKVVLPGFVDSHTHLIFGGFREEEFSWRLKGESYMSIMERGGGIQSTVDATWIESVDSLFHKAEWFIARMIEMGVTAVEVKSGYGLDLTAEMKMLRVADKLRHSLSSRIGIATTFLGAHAVPSRFKGRTEEYVDLLIAEMLPPAKEFSEFCDVFCEKNVFELDDTQRILKAAKAMGYKLKLHADEIVTLGGAELAVDLEAVSADHLLHISDKGIKKMASSDTVATLLPLTAFALKEPYAPARKLIDAGCAVALATDLNPGSCFSGSIPLTIALACIYMGMSIEETITALTLNGAAAIDKAQSMGTIEVGKEGNFAILDSDNYNILPYYVGMNCVKTTVYKGNVVNVNK